VAYTLLAIGGWNDEADMSAQLSNSKSSPSTPASGTGAALPDARLVGRLVHAEGEWLAADIGGTHARFDRWADGRLERGARRTYRNDQFADITALIQRYREDIGSQSSQAMLAVASPIGRRETLRMINRDWSLDAVTVRAGAGLTRLCLVNDLVAAAAGIRVLDVGEAEVSPGDVDEAAPKLVIGVGTGLGAAVILASDNGIRVLASEAGHMTAAVRANAIGVCDRASRLYGRASWERLLSGPGLSLFEASERGDDKTAAPEDIVARALAGEASATEAVRAFVRTLGEFAGDLSLAVCAFGGVYFVGGVVQGLGRLLDFDELRPGFESKGRFAAYLRNVPLYRVMTDDLAARGIAGLLAGAVEAPVLEA